MKHNIEKQQCDVCGAIPWGRNIVVFSERYQLRPHHCPACNAEITFGGATGTRPQANISLADRAMRELRKRPRNACSTLLPLIPHIGYRPWNRTSKQDIMDRFTPGSIAPQTRSRLYDFNPVHPRPRITGRLPHAPRPSTSNKPDEAIVVSSESDSETDSE